MDLFDSLACLYTDMYSAVGWVLTLENSELEAGDINRRSLRGTNTVILTYCQAGPFQLLVH